MRFAALLIAFLFSSGAGAQWQLQDAHTTADLRGIDSLGGGVAWASGTNGTVLRTEDAGFVWQLCAIPPGAEKLDFRGIQAFDHNTAIVMSSGKGDQSRLYKTTDGCQTWKLLFTDPDKDGFWDAMQFEGGRYGMLLGDPVDGAFATFISLDGGTTWSRQRSSGLSADSAREGAFAASNSSLIVFSMLAHRFFVTGGVGGALFIQCHGELGVGGKPERVDCLRNQRPLPLASGSPGAGAFALGVHNGLFIAVGGDYTKPNDPSGTAAVSKNSDDWSAAKTPPHGYRSAVAYDAGHKTWITVGPNGTDISTDDGRNWRPLEPRALDPPDADQHWNALSLPFVVGPHGRIGTLRQDALK